MINAWQTIQRIYWKELKLCVYSVHFISKMHSRKYSSLCAYRNIWFCWCCLCGIDLPTVNQKRKKTSLLGREHGYLMIMQKDCPRITNSFIKIQIQIYTNSFSCFCMWLDYHSYMMHQTCQPPRKLRGNITFLATQCRILGEKHNRKKQVPTRTLSEFRYLSAYSIWTDKGGGQNRFLPKLWLNSTLGACVFYWIHTN